MASALLVSALTDRPPALMTPLLISALLVLRVTVTPTATPALSGVVFGSSLPGVNCAVTSMVASSGVPAGTMKLHAPASVFVPATSMVVPSVFLTIAFTEPLFTR